MTLRKRPVGVVFFLPCNQSYSGVMAEEIKALKKLIIEEKMMMMMMCDGVN